tara:strand:+ start:802 stop:1578 length:777 start_codon:yes stop_codon:yes gene_type:complete
MDSAYHAFLLFRNCLFIWAIVWPCLIQAKDENNPFLSISKRNAFSLSEAPSQRTTAPKQEVKKPTDIKLTGIFQRNGIERAALAILEPEGKSFKASFLQLAKGEHQGVIKIDNIDRRNGIVTLSVNGTRRKLNFKDDAYAPAISQTRRSIGQPKSPPPAKKLEKGKKDKKEKKSKEEKLAKIDDAVSRGKMTKANAALKSAVLKGELTSERAKIASFLEKGIIDDRSYQALDRLGNRALKSAVSELKDARKLNKGKTP